MIIQGTLCGNADIRRCFDSIVRRYAHLRNKSIVEKNIKRFDEAAKQVLILERDIAQFESMYKYLENTLKEERNIIKKERDKNLLKSTQDMLNNYAENRKEKERQKKERAYVTQIKDH